MMRVLLDTNVVLDVLLEREPWVQEAKIIWDAHEEGKISCFLVASALTDIFYFARKLHDIAKAHASIKTCLDTFTICTVDRVVLEQALALPGSDFEDNVQIACATVARLDGIVTRDKDGFKQAAVAAFTPAELIAQLP